MVSTIYSTVRRPHDRPGWECRARILSRGGEIHRELSVRLAREWQLRLAIGRIVEHIYVAWTAPLAEEGGGSKEEKVMYYYKWEEKAVQEYSRPSAIRSHVQTWPLPFLLSFTLLPLVPLSSPLVSNAQIIYKGQAQDHQSQPNLPLARGPGRSSSDLRQLLRGHPRTREGSPLRPGNHCSATPSCTQPAKARSVKKGRSVATSGIGPPLASVTATAGMFARGQHDIRGMIGYLTATLSEDWAVFLDVCERASTTEADAKEAAKVLRREYDDALNQLSATRLWALLLRNSSELFVYQCAKTKFLHTIEDVLASQRTSPVVRERLLDVLAAASYASSGVQHEFESSFRLLWRKFKPTGKPDEGIPLAADDVMFHPPSPRPSAAGQSPF
ncbi:hypothetical protein BC827DRAFT_503185 [Russula dissimulans]|nr:hypothetical protein BC827DRAFT_503185 [Russula dissimulans]